jgi:hypothetical protein
MVVECYTTTVDVTPRGMRRHSCTEQRPDGLAAPFLGSRRPPFFVHLEILPYPSGLNVARVSPGPSVRTAA